MSDLFSRIIRHLLPRARAWRAFAGSMLRRLIDGLSGVGSDAREFVDDVYGDGFPGTTRTLDRWEAQFGLTPGDLSIGERRARLDSAWKAVGGQSPRYIQDVLQGAGFDVWIYEWWVPESSPVEARDPRAYVGATAIGTNRCGMPGVRCGVASATCNDTVLRADAFLLVNRGLETPIAPAPPSDPDQWPFILYLGGEAFGTQAQIPASRRLEFETLALQICPTHLWLGLIVDYT